MSEITPGRTDVPDMVFISKEEYDRLISEDFPHESVIALREELEAAKEEIKKKEKESQIYWDNSIRLVGENERLKAELEAAKKEIERLQSIDNEIASNRLSQIKNLESHLKYLKEQNERMKQFIFDIAVAKGCDAYAEVLGGKLMDMARIFISKEALKPEGEV